MFATSHRYGPLIGLALSLFLILLGFPLDYRVLGFTGLVSMFWLYVPAVKRARYVPLSLGSLQHLCFAIMWASHGYGGLASPFLLWLAVVPLLAFLYLSPNVRLWVLLVLMIAANVAGLACATVVSPPPLVDPRDLQWLALLSILSASVYVSMMAIHFARILNSRDEIEREVARYRASASALGAVAVDLKLVGATKAAMVKRIGQRAAPPLSEITAACDLLHKDAAAGDGVGAADLRSIAEAARYLGELVGDIDRCAGLTEPEVHAQYASCDLQELLKDIALQAQSWPRPASIVVELSEPATLVTNRAVLEQAVAQVVRHLGRSAPGAAIRARATRLPGADHLAIDLFRDQAGEAEPVTARPRAVETRTGLGPALAGRMLSFLGASLSRHPARVDGSYFRIELPPTVA